ncbi:hypothetical protein BH09PAT1_BH09PAT1_7250 [soil metagenome]
MSNFNDAWLSGFIDGEGSVGLTKSKETYIPTLQITTTCQKSCEYIIDVLIPIIGKIPSWSYQEKRPEIHRDSYYIRVTGMGRISKVIEAVLPYSITKKEHWELLKEFIKIRIELTGTDNKGNIKRGGKNRKPYGEREKEIYTELRAINRRGPRTEEYRKLHKNVYGQSNGNQQFTRKDFRVESS